MVKNNSLKAIVNYGRSDYLHGDPHNLFCCICGEEDRNKLIVEDMGISVGMCTEEYTFCKECWGSPNLGEIILNLIGYADGLKIKEDFIEYAK